MEAAQGNQCHDTTQPQGSQGKLDKSKYLPCSQLQTKVSAKARTGRACWVVMGTMATAQEVSLVTATKAPPP